MTDDRNQRGSATEAVGGDNRQHQAANVAPTPVARRPRVAFRRMLLALLVMSALMAGVAIGVLGHGRILTAIDHVTHGGQHAHATSEGNQLWTCGMHPQVIRDKPGLCPICQMQLEPLGAPSRMSATTPASERKLKYWWDPMMNPPYISERPGKSPMGMDLVPVYEDEVSAGAPVRIDPVVVQNMGVRVVSVTAGPVIRDIRAVGYLDEAQPNVRDVNLRVSGWVERLYADTVGMALSQGAPLFELYSPAVQVAVEELIGARRSFDALGAGADPLARKTAETLLDATRLKLEQWGLDAEQVKRLAELERPGRTVTFASPIDGYLTQKMVAQGTAVKAGDTVLRVVDLSTVWLDLQVYAQDLSFVRTGQKVNASVEGMNGRQIEGEIVFVAPQVDPQTRTATVRVALPNNELTLRPGMFATAHIHAEAAKDALLVPREAVIDTGRRQVVFVASGNGHFEPRQVKLGAEGAGGVVQVREGLAPGETVVTSGQFLLDAESRMQEAIQKHLAEKLAGRGRATPAGADHAGHGPATLPVPSSTPVREVAAPGSPGPSPSAQEDGATAEFDAVFVEYLKLQAVLGGKQQTESPVDPRPLAEAAQALEAQVSGSAKKHVDALAVAAAAVRDQPLPEQRKRYKALSDAVIALAGVRPPSSAVARELFVAYCPMAPGDGGRWLQATPTIANPYFATSMKECGSVERVIATAREVPTTRPATTTTSPAHEGHGTTRGRDGAR